MSKLFKIVISFCFLMVFLPCYAELTYSDLKNLLPLPDSYYNLTYQERLDWLNTEVEKNAEPLEKYRLKRELSMELYYANDQDGSANVCKNNEPLREDIFYRENCIFATHQKFEAFLPHILELIHDSRQFGNERAAALLLVDFGWRQSQHGDIGGAFASYETALSIAPSGDIELLNRILMDTATNYIVHGDKNYILKGINLLKRSREQSQQALNDPADKSDKIILIDNILLSNFNTGIAYVLHLYDYPKALEYFDKVNAEFNGYQLSSLSFSAIAAAEIGQFDRARNYLDIIAERKENDPVMEHYLDCYRQLAKRHWDNQQSLSSCFTLTPETTIEVQLDVAKRLAQSDDKIIEYHGLKQLKDLFINKLEPQLLSRGSQAASNTELQRLQRESELKSVVLSQQKQLQQERDLAYTHRQNFLIALFTILIIFTLLVVSQLRQKKKLAKQFEKMSIRDPLTKLGNRRFLEQQIERELAYIARAIRSKQNIGLGIFLFDIDHFKHINDTYGHHIGDEVLVEFSKRISVATRDTDLLVRWGGEEFVYVARLDTNDRVYELADRILKAINGQPFSISGHPSINVTCTIGAVKYPFMDTNNNDKWSQLISLADSALYYGKQKSRNCWIVINNENIIQKEEIENLISKPLQQSIEENLVTIRASLE